MRNEETKKYEIIKMGCDVEVTKIEYVEGYRKETKVNKKEKFELLSALLMNMSV